MLGVKSRQHSALAKNAKPSPPPSGFAERGTIEADPPRSPFEPCGTCSTTELQAFRPDGNRTRDTVINSEVSDLFTTVRQGACRGTDETETTPVAQGQAVVSEARSPRRDAHCGGRLHGTQSDAGVAALVERLLREVSVLFTTDNQYPGERATRPLAFPRRRNPRLHHLDFQNLLCFPFNGCGGAGNKNPSGAWAREGFDQLELWKAAKPFRLRESACTGNPVRSTGRPNSDCRSCCACRRSRLSRATIAP